MLVSWAWLKKPDLSMVLNGVLAGLVGITAGAYSVGMFDAIIICAVAGALVVFSIVFFDRINIDDLIKSSQLSPLGWADVIKTAIQKIES